MMTLNNSKRIFVFGLLLSLSLKVFAFDTKCVLKNVTGDKVPDEIARLNAEVEYYKCRIAELKQARNQAIANFTESVRQKAKTKFSAEKQRQAFTLYQTKRIIEVTDKYISSLESATQGYLEAFKAFSTTYKPSYIQTQNSIVQLANEGNLQSGSEIYLTIEKLKQLVYSEYQSFVHFKENSEVLRARFGKERQYYESFFVTNKELFKDLNIQPLPKVSNALEETLDKAVTYSEQRYSIFRARIQSLVDQLMIREKRLYLAELNHRIRVEMKANELSESDLNFVKSLEAAFAQAWSRVAVEPKTHLPFLEESLAKKQKALDLFALCNQKERPSWTQRACLLFQESDKKTRDYLEIDLPILFNASISQLKALSPGQQAKWIAVENLFQSGSQSVALSKYDQLLREEGHK